MSPAGGEVIISGSGALRQLISTKKVSQIVVD